MGRIEAAKLVPGVLGAEPQVDGGLRVVAFPDQGVDFPREGLLAGSRCFRQERDRTLNSISAMFNQLPCFGV